MSRYYIVFRKKLGTNRNVGVHKSLVLIIFVLNTDYLFNKSVKET